MESRHPLDTRLPEMLRSGRRLRGVFNGIPSPAIVEMCSYAGFDFIIIDNEHGSADFQLTEHLLRAAHASGIVAIVRCLRHDISRILDMGAGGILVPMVNSAEDAQELVNSVRYPMAGHPQWARGCAFSTRAAGYGAFGGTDHTERSNRGIALIAMIETPQGVAAAAQISAVDGLDGIFIGPNDLAHSMGHQNRWHEAPVQAAIASTLKAVAPSGLCAGILALTAEEEERYAAFGARLFASVTTGIITKALAEAARQSASELRY